jgi:type I restriction enzyme S subunit
VKVSAYPRYKPSGIDWLGDVPEHWDVKRLKTSARCWVSNVDKVPAEDELPVRLCNYTDVYYHDEITADMELMESTATAEEIDRFGLLEGDVLITKDSEDWRDIAVPALVRTTAPDLVCGYHLGIIRSRPKLLFGDYLLRAFQSCAINQQFQVAASGVTRYGLPKASIGDAWIPIPVANEQQAIAAFLHRETAQVSRLVAKKQELIERLKEKRTALISRTVTRGLPLAAARAAGLSENPLLKRSGIEWLGDIPGHWEAAQLRRKAHILDCKHRTVSFVDEGIPLASIREVHGFEVDLTNANQTSEDEYLALIEGDRRPRVGDIIYSRNVTVGDAALVTTSERFCMGQDVCLIRAPKHHPKYLLYLFRSAPLLDQVESLMIGSTFRRINVGQIHAFWICVPPLPEQFAIAAYLEAETGKLDALMHKVEEAIERLLEYRTALITAAVTGKIDVRKTAAA